MFLGKPVVATGWSGNMTFMRPGVSWPVGYKLVPVAPEDYPAWEGQVWAEPDVGEAASALVRLIEDPVFAGRMGRRAQAHMRKHFSDAALGVRYRARLAAIVGEHPTRFGAGSLTPSATDQH
jgi:glycosyltransferase involved in cell wall biosynthesis